ncbi:MAG: type III-B CRISPR module-associated protein Cmr5 [Verrucomicrobiota bacterium]|nr:type III-B CRISPR module-associated protein Cmr5 [Verrucomicrobiae bacterium]MDW8381476.1 type III-B CRISPR module-associated protein Cmr5 [Verrucomicrobiota bacterium]
MKNLDQIRAARALLEAKDISRSAVNKLPALILSNGLLATAAFCEAEGTGENRADMKKAMEATAKHLAEQGYVSKNVTTVRMMIEDLAQRSSLHLQQATAEALAFIAYLKRFAPKE